MPFTTGNDLNILQSTDTAVVGAGAGDDTYIIGGNIGATQTITISDTEGANMLALPNNLTIASSLFAADSAQLTLSNGGVININGASSFTYALGGDPLSNAPAVTQNYSDFVTSSMGAAAVPTGSNTEAGAANTTVNADGSTSNGGGSGGSTGSTTGQTFTLTTAADTIPGLIGSANTPDSSGDDTIVATEATLGSGDLLLDAGGANDTLRYASSGSTAVSTSGFTIEGVETIQVTADNTAGTSFDMTGVDGAESYINDNSSGDLTATGLQNLVDITLNDVSGGDTTIQFVDSVLAGSSDTVKLTLNNVQSNTGAAVSTLNIGNTSSSGTTGIETLNLTTTGKASLLSDINTGAATINIEGDQNLTIGTTSVPLEGVTQINAQTFTGNLSVVADSGAVDTVVTGGTGDDTADFSAGFDAGDSFDGGDNTDTIGMTMTIASGPLGGSLSNVEQLLISDNSAGTIDMDNFSGINRVIFDSGIIAGGSTTISDAVTGITVEVDTSNPATTNTTNNTSNLTVDLKTDGASDAVAIAFDDVAAADTFGTLTVDDAETLTITADDDTAGGTATLAITTLDLDTTSGGVENSDAVTLVFSGDADLTIAAFDNPATPVVATIDASGMTGKLGDGSVTGIGSVGATTALSTAASGAIYTFGSGGTDWTMGAIVGTQTGGDTINMGAGADTIRYTNANQSSGLTSDTVIGFEQGSDVINLTNIGVNTSTLFLGNAANTTAAETALSSTAGEAIFIQSDNVLVVDTNGDGDIGNADFRITLDGITSLTAADLGFVGGVTFTANQAAFNTATAAHSSESNAVTNDADTINATVAQLVGSTVNGLLGTDTLNISATAAANEVANLVDGGGTGTASFTAVETVTIDSSVEGVSMDSGDLGTGLVTKITGVSGVNQALFVNTGSDISDVTLTNIEALDVTGAATMTLAQHNAFSSITATGGADSITLDDAGTLTGDADIEAYVLANGTNIFTIGAAGQNITENDGVNSVLGAGLALTGNFVNFDADDTLTMTTGGSINGAQGNAGGAGTALGFGTLVMSGTVSMTKDQHNAFATITATGANDEIQITDQFIGSNDADIELYDLNGTDNTITLNTSADVEAGGENDVVVVNGITLGADTIDGEGTGTASANSLGDNNDTIQLVTGSNISAATVQNFEQIGVNDNASVTMTAAQFGTFSNALSAAVAADASGIETVTITDAINDDDTGTLGQAIENYVLSSGNDSFGRTDVSTVAGSINISAGGADTITLDNNAIAAISNPVTITGFTADDTLLSTLAGASLHTAFENVTDTDPNVASGTTALLVIDSGVYETLNPTDVVNGASVENGLIGAIGTIADGNYSVVVYGNSNAYLYQMAVVDSNANGNIDVAADITVELIGTLENIAADSLTSANFA